MTHRIPLKREWVDMYPYQHGIEIMGIRRTRIPEHIRQEYSGRASVIIPASNVFNLVDFDSVCYIEFINAEDAIEFKLKYA